MADKNQAFYNELGVKYGFEENETVEMELKCAEFACFIKNFPIAGMTKNGHIYLTGKRLIFVKGKDMNNSNSFCIAYKDVESLSKCFIGFMPHGIKVAIKNDEKNRILYLLGRGKILDFVGKHLS